MLYAIASRTPIWVWALFGYLVFVGVTRLRPSVRDVRAIALLPLFFIAWGLFGLYQQGTGSRYGVLGWLGAAVVGAALGFLPTQTLTVDAARPRVRLPGSALPLLRNTAIFGAHYVLNVAAAMHPQARTDLLGLELLVSGFSAGYFVGWALRFVLAWRAAPRVDLDEASWPGARHA